MRKTALALVVFGAFTGQAAGLCATTTIVSHETEKWFYKEGKMERFEGQYENTYFLDLSKDTLVRTRIYDYQTKLITPDDTKYKIQKQLDSHPTNAARFARPEAMIRAFGQPSSDAVEVIVIRDGSVESALSTPGQLVVSSAKRLK
jgi:hypothetical protein